MFMLIILQRMEEARRAAEAEIRDYNALMQWLDKADEVLQIVEEPIIDIEKEYMVSSCIKKCFYVFDFASICGVLILV